MEEVVEGARKKTLAVFENVVTSVVTKEREKKRNFYANRFASDDDSSPSESELVIDDEVKDETAIRKKAKVAKVRLKKEILALKCQWGCCVSSFGNIDSLEEHLIAHCCDEEDTNCHWSDCPSPENIPNLETLIRHVSYHAYLTRLANIGENVLKRNSLPDCSMEKNYSIEIPYLYECEWENCKRRFNTIHQLFVHMDDHISGVPTGKKAGFPEIIACRWSGCGVTAPTRYKLAIHLRVHTKERIVACPTCMATFTTKGAFSDHRTRQLNVGLRSYQCSQCLKLFSGERLLSDHMRSHINQYKCSMCDMTSPKPSMLARHYRYRHMDVRMFTCHLCSKKFVTKGNLVTHLLTHEEKPFKCEQCEFGCKSKVGLKSHMVKVHGLETETYECEVCKLQYKRGGYLTYHLIKFHNFHWPSGHCRFRYRKDADGIHRLQTVRYESLEVTEQVIRSESMPTTKHPSAVTYQVTYDKDDGGEYSLTVLEEDVMEIEVEPTRIMDPETGNLGENGDGRPIIFVIEDVDDKGKVVKRTELDSKEFCLKYNETFERRESTEIRDMPVVDISVKAE